MSNPAAPKIYKEYRPNWSSQAPRIPEEEWQKHDQRISELHAASCTSKQARAELRAEAASRGICFQPSPSQYAARLQALGLMKYRIKRRRVLLATQHDRSAKKLPRGDTSFDETSGERPGAGLSHKLKLALHTDEVATPNSAMSIRDSDFRLSNWKHHLAPSPVISPPGEIPEASRETFTTSQQGSGSGIDLNPSFLGATAAEHSYEAEQDLFDLFCFDAEEPYVGSGSMLPDSPTLRPTLDIPGLNLLPVGDGYDKASASLLAEKNTNVIPGYSISDDILHLCPGIDIGSNQLEPQILKGLESAAGFLCAAQSKADAFDLYFAVFNVLRQTLDFGSRRILIATLNCARSSENNSQHECAVGMLLHALRWHEERNLSNSHWSYVIHSYLSDVYAKMGKEEAEIHETEVMYCSDYNALSRFVLFNIPDATNTTGYFPNNHQIALRLESRLRQNMGSTLQTSGYTTSFPSTSAASSHVVGNAMDTNYSKERIKGLLEWCESALAARERSFDAWIKVLPDEPAAAQDFIGCMLYCYLMEQWLEEAQRGLFPPTVVEQLNDDLMRSAWAIPETIAALSSIIVDETFPGDLWTSMSYRSRILSKLHLIPSIIAPHLLATVRILREESSQSDRKFADVYQPLATMSSKGGGHPITNISRQALRLFSRNVVSTAQSDRTSSKMRRKPGTLRLMPSVTELRSRGFRSQSLFSAEYSPQFSINNRANPPTLSDVKYAEFSTYSSSFPTRPTTSSGISMESHSSWSFTRVTGMPCASLDEVMVDA